MPTVLIQGPDDAYLSKLAISGKTMEQLHFAKQKTLHCGLKNMKKLGVIELAFRPTVLRLNKLVGLKFRLKDCTNTNNCFALF